MVGEVGIEPTTNRLRAECSTTELLTQAGIVVQAGFWCKVQAPRPFFWPSGQILVIFSGYMPVVRASPHPTHEQSVKAVVPLPLSYSPKSGF